MKSILRIKPDKVKTKALSKEVAERVDKLKHDLNIQRNKLTEFRHSRDIEEVTKSSSQKIKECKEGKKNSSLFFENEENFFHHLELFESNFKNIRDEVLELINNGNKKLVQESCGYRYCGYSY